MPAHIDEPSSLLYDNKVINAGARPPLPRLWIPVGFTQMAGGFVAAAVVVAVDGVAGRAAENQRKRINLQIPNYFSIDETAIKWYCAFHHQGL